MTAKTILDPGWARAKTSGFAMGTRLGDTVYVAGQVAIDGDGQVVGVGDMTAQSRQVFANVEAVLRQAGASMADVVKITAWVTDMSRYGEYAAVRAEIFPNADMASATVSSPILVKSDYLVEVETIAVVGCGR